MSSSLLTSNSSAVGALTPKRWLVEPGRTTPAGVPSTYRSSIHALMGLRLGYRRDALNETNAVLEIARDRYQTSWERFNRHGSDMQAIVRLVVEGDVGGAVGLWNGIDQDEVDKAFR